MSIYNSIEESFEKTKNNIGFKEGKKKDITWIGKYMDIFYQYAKECPNHIAEIGVNKVCSTWAWAMARPKKLTLCDINLFERGSIWLESLIDLCSKESIEVVLEEKSSLQLDLEDVELLFIDGLHEYNHIKEELARFSSKVSKYIIFHDNVLFEREVNRAATEFLAINSEWKEVYRANDNPGILIIKRIS